MNIKLNTIFVYFILSQLSFLFGYFYKTDLISNINITNAFVLQLIGILFFIIGGLNYRAFPRTITSVQTKSKFFLSDKFFIFSYLLILVGVLVSAAQVFMFVPPVEYFRSLFGGTYNIGLRDAFLTTSENGSLPGYVKMFDYTPLSIYLMSLGLLTFLDSEQKSSLKKLSKYALVGTLIKVFFSLDRLTIMAILLANIFIAIKNRSLAKKRYVTLIIFVFLIANYLSLKRLEGYGIIDFVLLYFKLGLVNFELMIKTVSNHTYGWATFLSPFTFIEKVLGIHLFETSSTFSWEWNPAQYFTSYLYQDFGYFYFVIFYFLGILVSSIDKNAYINIYYSSTYFVILYGAISFLFVPAIRGIEFWFALLLPVLLLKFNKLRFKI